MSWVHTLKFKIVALAVATGVLSTVGTAELLLRTTRSDIETLLLESGANNRQATAALLATKLDILQTALSAIARSSPPELWRDTAALQRRIAQYRRPALFSARDPIRPDRDPRTAHRSGQQETFGRSGKRRADAARTAGRGGGWLF